VVSVCEVAGLEEQTIKLHELVRFQEHEKGGQYVSSGMLPLNYEVLQRTGVSLPRSMFQRAAMPEAR
jgi:hypothetical protein